jgi:hypothetical protein
MGVRLMVLTRWQANPLTVLTAARQEWGQDAWPLLAAYGFSTTDYTDTTDRIKWTGVNMSHPCACASLPKGAAQ